MIKLLLASCDGTATTIVVTKSYESTRYEELLIDLELPPNIKQIYINNYKDSDDIRLKTYVNNTELISIEGKANFGLQENEFFNYYFKVIQKISVQTIKSNMKPSLSLYQI